MALKVHFCGLCDSLGKPCDCLTKLQAEAVTPADIYSFERLLDYHGSIGAPHVRDRRNPDCCIGCGTVVMAGNLCEHRYCSLCRDGDDLEPPNCCGGGR